MALLSLFAILLFVFLPKLGLSSLASFIISIVINILFLVLFLKFKSLLKVFDGTSTNARFIGTFYSGELESLKPHFKLLWQNLIKICKELNIPVITINIDKNDPLKDYYYTTKTFGGGTRFMWKIIQTNDNT